ncbi:DUF2269 family protein [Pseudonocardia sp. ICBG1293]|uniref:DUF2269 family protein n=1 Tax=Pseudonocardia sp. ICBG1293 TaxID=2844382 RepID=UPI001CCDE236|nr:DUF2269 family protein [Pseudonocardia sp. ICBG1293]
MARVRKRVRQLLVFLHVAVSVGWMGAGAANVVLAGVALGADPATAAAAYRFVDVVDWWLVIPLAFAALVTGVVVAVASPWGLTRHWWVLVKLVLTVAVIVWSTLAVGVWVEESVVAFAAGETASPVGGALVTGAALNIAAFLFMTWALVATPWGRTPWAPARRRVARGPAARTPA